MRRNSERQRKFQSTWPQHSTTNKTYHDGTFRGRSPSSRANAEAKQSVLVGIFSLLCPKGYEMKKKKEARVYTKSFVEFGGAEAGYSRMRI